MAPRNIKDSAETNMNGNTGGKGKGKEERSMNSSTASLPHLTAETLDKGVEAVRRMSKVLSFMQTWNEELDSVQDLYGLSMRQQDRIDELDTLVNELIFRRDQEFEKLKKENGTYKAKDEQFKSDQERLKIEIADMDATRIAMQVKVDKQKEIEIEKMKKHIDSEANAKIKQTEKDAGKKIQALESNKDGLKNEIKTLKEKTKQAREDLKTQKEGLEMEKRSFQAHIKNLETELQQIKATSIVSPRTPDF